MVIKKTGVGNMKNLIAVLVLIVLVVFFNISMAIAGGFLIYDHDAAATGMGLAYTAQVDRPSAVFYNPAAMSRLKGTSISTGGAIIIPRTTYRNPITGHETEMKHHTYFVPNFYVTHKMSDEFTAGFGFFCPFGISTDWPDNWEGRFISTFTEIKTYFLNPAISWQVHPRLSLAVGFDYVFSEVEMKRAINLSKEVGIPGLPEGRTKIEGDGEGQGFNLGLLYHVTKDIDFGMSYRSRIDIDYDGDAWFNIPATGIGIIDASLANIFQNGDVSIDNIDLPSILVVGLSTTMLKNWTFEFDFYWINWSTFNKISADFENPNTPDTIILRDWYDSLFYALGAKYQLNKSIVLRGGYMFRNTPIPSRTLDPILPDSDSHLVNFGVGYQNKGLSIDLGYKAVFYNDRTTQTNIQGFNGTYESFASLIAINLQYVF